MIQLRNVPDALHRRLKSRAAMSGLTLSDYLIREAEKSVAFPTPHAGAAAIATGAGNPLRIA